MPEKRRPRGKSRKVLEKLELANLLAFNLTPNIEIARQTGLSYSTINRLFPNQFKKQMEAKFKTILELKQQGFTVREIVAQTGIAYTTVYWLLKKNKEYYLTIT